MTEKRIVECCGLQSKKIKRLGSWVLITLLACVALILPCVATADQVTVRHTEGTIRGFLVLRSQDDAPLADGDLTQTVHGDRVTIHLEFHFKDGSIFDETTVFSQRGTFRLLSDHLIQKGPAFKNPMGVSVEASTGHVTVHYADEKGEKVLNQTMKLPPDLSNGMIFTLLKNVQPSAPQTTVSMLVATPKPRIVKLLITPQGDEPFALGHTDYKAMKYTVKVEIGGVAGVVAPLVGEQPPDTHAWVFDGGSPAPAFVKSEGPLFQGGPIWRIELASPVWPQSSTPDTSKH